MSTIDFANSYVSFFGPQRDDGARVPIDAACTVIDKKLGHENTFYLIAPCRSERMYLDGSLFHMPNWDWRAIFSSTERVILRRFWVSGPAGQAGRSRTHQYGDSQGALIQLRHLPDTRVLSSDAEVVEEALGTRPFVVKTKISDEESGLRAILEYPVNTMNAQTKPPRFQVDAGPLLVPDFGSTEEHMIERFDVAYVVYNVFDKAEFILRRPVPVSPEKGQTPSVTDYSVVLEIPATHEILVGV